EQDFDGTSSLPGAGVTIWYDPDKHPGWGTTYGITDANGKFRMQYSSMHGSPSGIYVKLNVLKSGYFGYLEPVISNQYKTLEMGQRWLPGSNGKVYLKPRGNIKLEVEDELGEPAKSHV